MKKEKVYAVGFKGFAPGMKCRDKQYQENSIFEEEKAEMCASGIHFCENPLDVLNYYPLLDENCQFNEFAKVEALAEVERDGDKSVTRKLKIGLKFDLRGFIEAAVDFSLKWVKKVDFEKKITSGDGSKLASSGDGSKLASSGVGSQLASSGDGSVIASVGAYGKVKASLGSFIACAEWKMVDGEIRPVALLSAKVDGVAIKADTWYTVTDGKFVEVKE
jgi:hypothetical protein